MQAQALDPFLRDRIASWEYLTRQAVSLEGWGQQVEALEVYEKLRADVENNLNLHQNAAMTARTTMMKFSQCIQGRIARIRNPRSPGLEVEAISKLCDQFHALFTGQAPFPIEIGSLKVAEGQARGGPTAMQTSDNAKSGIPSDVAIGETKVGAGTLLAPPKVGRGEVVAKISVQRIGLKDAETYLEPFITVSVRDSMGKEIEGPQDTPTTTKRDKTYINFDCGVYLQTPLSRIPDTANIFLEFKHWKAKEKKYSVKCWSMMSKAELTEGSATLEIYAKPADYTAKKFSRHSVKDLYLHVGISLVTN